MEGKHILIIGAGGYLGAHISLAMAQQGAYVTALCHSPKDDTAWNREMHRIICGDITQMETIRCILQHDYDYAIYLISLNHFDSEGEINQVCQTNVLPLWNLENLLKDRIKKFIYFSTQQVYGRTTSAIINEDTLPAPVNNYGLTHLLCENITGLFNRTSSAQYINVRLSNGYGAPVFRDNNCWWLVINDLCKTAFLEKTIRLQSDGSPLRDFIHVSDICQAIGSILNNDSNENIYNISSGTSYTIGEIALFVQKTFKQVYNQNIPILLPEGKVLKTDTDSRCKISNQRLQKLGFTPQVNIETGIHSIFHYLESQYPVHNQL